MGNGKAAAIDTRIKATAVMTMYDMSRIAANGYFDQNDSEEVQTLFAWSFAKRSFAKFNGCDSDKFVIHLIECEWRYNHREDDLYKELAKILKRY